MKTKLTILLFVGAFAFAQENEIFVKSRLPIVKIVYNKGRDLLFFNKFNENEIHVFTFDHTYSTILNGPGSAVLDFDISKNGNYAITANQDNSISVWQVKPKEMMLTFEPEQGLLQRIYFFGDDYFFSLGENGKLKKWNIAGQLMYESNISELPLKAITSYESKIVLGGSDKKVRIVDDRTKKIDLELGLDEVISALWVDENKNCIYIGDSKGNLHKYNVLSGKRKTMKAHKSVVTDLKDTGKGYLATSSWDKTIKLVDTDSFTIVKTFTGHKDYIFSLTVRDGILFSASRDMTVRQWNIEK